MKLGTKHETKTITTQQIKKINLEEGNRGEQNETIVNRYSPNIFMYI